MNVGMCLWHVGKAVGRQGKARQTWQGKYAKGMSLQQTRNLELSFWKYNRTK